MAGLTQHLTQLLHAVAVHDDGVPAAKTEEARCQRRTPGLSNNACLEVLFSGSNPAGIP